MSNFELDDLNELLSSCKVVPQIYQGNAWQLWFRPEVLQRLSEERVVYQAYNVVNGIVMREGAAPRAYRVLADVARAKNVDVGTVVLAALKRRGVATIPRASSPQHLAANAPRAVAAVALDDEEVHTIDAAMKALARAPATSRRSSPSWRRSPRRSTPRCGSSGGTRTPARRCSTAR